MPLCGYVCRKCGSEFEALVQGAQGVACTTCSDAGPGGSCLLN